MNDNLIGFALPCNYEGVFKAMEGNKGVPRRKCTREQAVRVSWRIVKDCVQAQLAICEAQVANIVEVFLPYAIMPNGNTVYQEIKSNGMVALMPKN